MKSQNQTRILRAAAEGSGTAPRSVTPAERASELLAQARWLDDKGRHADALELIRQATELEGGA